MKKFRAAFLIEPTHHDLTILKQYVSRIEFLSSGSDDVDELPVVISEKLIHFNPETDVIIPVGSVLTSLLVGVLLSKTFLGKTIWVGVYHTNDNNVKDYFFKDILWNHEKSLT